MRVPFVMVVLSMSGVRVVKVELGARSGVAFLGEIGERRGGRVASDETGSRVTARERSSSWAGRERGMTRLGVTVGVDRSAKKGVGEGVRVGRSRVIGVALILAKRVRVPR
jgi:hypothetical protein